jgi:hypothetical protein
MEHERTVTNGLARCERSMMGQKLLGIQSGWWTWSSSVGRKILREIEVWSTHAVFGKTTLKTGIAPQQQMLTTESGRSLQIQKRGRPITTAESAIATRRVGLFRRAGVRLNRRIRGERGKRDQFNQASGNHGGTGKLEHYELVGGNNGGTGEHYQGRGAAKPHGIRTVQAGALRRDAVPQNRTGLGLGK